MSLFLVDIFEEFLGTIRKHNESSGQASWDCPQCCEDKGISEDFKGNLEVNYQKGLFNCWACGATTGMHGPLEKLLKRYGNKKQLKQYLLLKPETDYDREKKDNLDENGDEIIRENNIKLPEGFKALKNCTSKDYKYDEFIQYWKERGIDDDIISKKNIGYTTTGKYHDRTVIPSYGEDGELNYFVTRTIYKRIKPKYLNPSEDEIPKMSIIFNERDINWDATIYLCEGTTDSLVLPNSIPLLGKVIGDYLKSKLITKAKGLIVICLDGDAFDDVIRLYKELNSGDLQGRIRIIKCPDGYDPSKINEIGGRKAIIKLLRNSRLPTSQELY